MARGRAVPPQDVPPLPGLSGARLLGRFLSLLRLAIRAIAAHLGPSRHNLEAQTALHLPAHLLKRLAEKFLDLSAAQTNEMGVLLLEAALIIMLVTFKMEQIQLIDQAAGFQELERPIDCDPIELGVFFLGKLVQRLGVQMLAGAVEKIQQDAALARKPYPAFAERILNSGSSWQHCLEGSKFASHSWPPKAM